MKDLSAILPRDLILDLQDVTVARAKNAHEVIRDRTPLKGGGARGAEGQLRFRLLEQGFEEVCLAHGGVSVGGSVTVNGIDYRIHQPFMRFTNGKDGVVLALASMPKKGELPHKNKSREAGVMLNYHVSPRLPLDAGDPQPGDIFVLFLAARDPARAGHIEEIAIGVIESDYKSYALYEPLDTFMARYAPPTSSKPALKLVKLKRKPAASEPKKGG